MEINYTDVYKEIDFISKELRKAIKHMPRYNRYNEGDRIINILLDVKIAVKLACKGRNYSLDSDKLYNDLITLGTLIDNFISSVNSYLGLMRHYKSYKVRKKFILSNIDEWMLHVTIGKGYQKINKVA